MHTINIMHFKMTYSGHANHELDYKSFQSCHNITNKLVIGKH